jgi:hypothetical protein
VIRLHDLRHCAASLLLVAGVPIKVVSERLGHTTIAMTMDVYGTRAAGDGRRRRGSPRRAPRRDRDLSAGRWVWTAGASARPAGGSPTGTVNRNNRNSRANRNGVMMARTATTEQVAAALHVGPAAVRKYAREHRLPFDTTPGGHRRFDVEEAMRAMGGEQPDAAVDRDGEFELPGLVPYVRIAPESEVTVVAVVTAVDDADIGVYDSARDVEDWAVETPLV